MRLEDENETHTSESRPTDNNAGNPNAKAREYSLETLMALQKLLEDGIPGEATGTQQRPPHPLPAGGNARQSEPAALVHPRGKLSDTLRYWALQLRSFFTRDKKSKTAGRGSSAQQRG